MFFFFSKKFAHQSYQSVIHEDTQIQTSDPARKEECSKTNHIGRSFPEQYPKACDNSKDDVPERKNQTATEDGGKAGRFASDMR